MLNVIPRSGLPIVSGAHEVEGYRHGGAPGSIFFVDSPPDGGPRPDSLLPRTLR